MPSLAYPPGVEEIFQRSSVALSLADPGRPDMPLILVNDRFCAVTGYARQDVLGHNCRFLQPPGGAGPVRQRLRQFLGDQNAGNARFVIPNQTREGEPFLNLLFMAKIRSASGSTLILGSQFAVGTGRERAASYQQALGEDLQCLSAVLKDADWMLLGSMETIANTVALLVRHQAEDWS